MQSRRVPLALAILCSSSGCGGLGDARGGVPSATTTTTAGTGGGDGVDTGAQGSTSTADPTLTSSGETTNAGDSADASDDGAPPVPPSRLDGLDFHCKVINGTSVQDPSANHLHTRFNLRATDLGIPLVVGDLLHLFFGDTHGYREIWAIGEDPDSVAFVDAAAAADDPTVLCTQLAFYATPDIPSVAADTDPTVQRDFAVGWMTPPPGQDIADYVGHHPAPFPNIPGSFEVPTGALAHGDDVYLFWAGRSELEPHARMTLGYLARWDPPRELPAYQIVRPIDALVDGALGGHFIQVAPFVRDDVVYMFGTGEFRRDGIHLARVPMTALESGDGQELWDPSSATWIDPSTLDPEARAAIAPVVEHEGVGELGGVYLEDPGLWLLMYQHATTLGGQLVANKIVVRTAPSPTGPWSEQLVVIDMADPSFQLEHCCLAEPCVGAQIWQCHSAGLYGAYPLPNPQVTAQDDGTFAVALPFLVSTWMPYDVVLFTARLVLAPA